MTARRVAPAGRTAGRAAPSARPRRRTDHHHRHGFLLAGLIISLAILLFRLTLVQVLDGTKYASYATSETEQNITLPAARGAIYDRGGDLLAVSVSRFDVIADDLQITDPAGTASKLLPLLRQAMPKLDLGTLTAELSRKSGYVIVAKEVTDSVESRIADLNLEGITFQNDTLRQFPGGEMFQPLIGGDYATGAGDGGLEYLYNDLLGGKAGSETIAEAPGGLQLPSGAHDVVAPKPGTSLVLTLDLPLQVEVTKDVEAQMRLTHATSGIAVVEDVHTGALLAMVDLVMNNKGVIAPAQQNLAATELLEPGSVMKLATIAFSLQDGLVSPSTVFSVPYSIAIGGYDFQDADPHPTENLPVSQILAQSSNVGTIKISQLLGLNRLAGAFKSLGFGLPTGLNWPGESDGIVGTPASWLGSAAGSVPIGTGVAVTPLQILNAYNAVANDGMLVTPHLVQGTIVNGHQTIAPVAKGHRALKASTVAELTPLLEGVTTDENGTALEAQISGYKVAGKTGTAPVPDLHGGYIPDDWNATFVGFAPADAPQLSAIVSFTHPNGLVYGGSEAAPVFAQFMQYALSHFDIAPPKTTSR